MRAPLQARWWLAGAFAGVGVGLVDGLLAYAPAGSPGDDAESLLGVASSVALWAVAGALAGAVSSRLLGAGRRESLRFGALGTGAWIALLSAAALAASAVAPVALHLAASILSPAATPTARTAVTLVATAALGLAGARALRGAAARRPVGVALAVGGLSLLLWLGLLGRDLSDAAPAPAASAPSSILAPPPSAPNVLLVVLDTTRADHLSAYGYARDTTPFLAELARESTLYENAVSPAPWTLPSHASLFTGQFPSVHGATAEHRWLRDEFLTLAEILRDQGYATAGFTNNAVVSHAHNLDQGFDQFTDVFLEWGPEFGWTEGRRRTVPENLLHRWREWRKPPDKGSARTNELVASWLDRWQAASPRRPFFVFVNLLEAHLPYAAPPAFRDRFVSGPPRPAIAGLSQSSWYHDAFRLMGTKESLTKEDYAQIAEQYDAELAYQDERLRDLVGELRKRGLLDDTLLVVVSDHGENLGEHGGRLNHVLSFHQTLLHVPLLVRRPGRFPAGLRYAPPVSTVSVFATVLDEAGSAAPPGQIPALGPLPRAASDAAPPFVVSEYELPVFEIAALADDVPGFDVGPLAVRQRAVRQGPWKLVRGTPGGAEVYDLARDPGEENPLEADAVPEGPALASLLDKWEAAIPGDSARGSSQHVLDESTRKALQGLGYVR